MPAVLWSMLMKPPKNITRDNYTSPPITAHPAPVIIDLPAARNTPPHSPPFNRLFFFVSVNGVCIFGDQRGLA